MKYINSYVQRSQQYMHKKPSTKHRKHAKQLNKMLQHTIKIKQKILHIVSYSLCWLAREVLYCLIL